MQVVGLMCAIRTFRCDVYHPMFARNWMVCVMGRQVLGVDQRSLRWLIVGNPSLMIEVERMFSQVDPRTIQETP